MKVIVTDTAWYQNSLVKEGDIIEFEGKKPPSWARKAELSKEDEAARAKAEAEAKAAKEKADKETADAKVLAEKFNELKVKAQPLGIVIDNEESLTIQEATEVYTKAIAEKEAEAKAAEAKKLEAEKEAAEVKAKAEAEAKKNAGK